MPGISGKTCVLCFQGLWERVCGGDQEWFFHQPEKGESCEKSKIFPGASVELPLYSVGIVRQHIPALFSVKQCHTKNFVALLGKLLYSIEKREKILSVAQRAWLAGNRETDRQVK